MAHISIIALSAFVALAGLHEGSAIPTVSLTARITVVSVRTESLILATPTSTSTSTPAMSLPTICLALVFSVFTSLLLVARFSPIGHDWRHATWASCFCWFIKVIISTVNIDVSGVILQDETYYDGLWFGFIVFSFLAVPIISGFAVQAITEVASTGVDKTTAKAVGNTPLISHAEYVERFSQNQENSLRNSRTADTVDEKRLLTEALKQAVELEACARRLSINHLPGGSQAQVILKADWNVHVRDVQAIHERYRSQPQAADKSQSDVNKAKAGGGRPQDAFGRPADVRRPLSEE
ncbi:hypothetical protein FRB98_008858 [Tulasnella sp. 332]|nr:hypothetical protein FRB98_008858 [Tulasnella sp. 332]